MSLNTDNEVATNGLSTAERKAAKKEVEAVQEEESFFKKNQTWFIVGGVCALFGLIAIIAVATGGGSSSSSSGSDKGIDVTGPTMAPSAMTGDGSDNKLPSALDPNNDGLATFECEQEPYFDAAGRLIFAGCKVF